MKSSSCLVIAAALVSLASLCASLPLHSSSSDEAIIVNGTQVAIADMANVFVYCRAEVSVTEDLHHYRLEWHSSTGPIPSWYRNAGVFSLGSGTHVPHSYLVFHNFNGATHAGNFTCKLFKRNQLAHSSDITVTRLQAS